MGNIMSADSLAELTQSFRQTVAMMYQALMNMEPILTRQLEILESMLRLGNILLFVCFLLIISVLYLTHKDAQGVKKFTEIKIKKRWLILLCSGFAVMLLVFNVYPRLALIELNRQITSKTSPEDAEKRLYGGTLSENAGRRASGEEK